LAVELEKDCINCGKLLEDSLLTHCSEKCYYEEYLKSQSVKADANEIKTNQD